MNKFDIKTKPAVKYFINNLGKSEYEDDKSKKEKIELEINVLNGKMNYIYGVKIGNPDKNFNDDSFVSKMIQCKNQNKINLLRYNCDYYFGKEQKINLELMVKSNSFRSFKINTTIGEIVGNENSIKCFNISDRDEILEVKATKVKTKMKYLTIHFNIKLFTAKGNKITKSQEEEYFKNEEYKIYFKIEKNNYLLYESEAYTDDGKFNIVQIPLNIINSDFIIYFFNYKNQNLASVKTNVNQITHKNFQNKLLFQKRLSLNDTLNIFNFSTIKEEITFLDYIKNGVRVALDIGIDFTGSNGHPDDLDTLHCRRPDAKERNPYERAILSCARIMANYDYDQLFPVYGFGAVIKGQKQASMCFNINFKEDPNIQYVDNIMKEYYACLDKIYFSGPTCFAPIINKIVNEIKKENDILEYHVLMILTDGKIDDFQDTVDALVEGSFLPLSVIIVGIGDNVGNEESPDYKFMNQLDGDDIPIISRNGKKRQRDLVQFVPFKKFEGDEKKLTEEVLDEIPRQIIEYYTLNFLYPELLLGNNNDNAQKESQIYSSNNSVTNSTNVFNNASYNPLDNQYTNNGESDNHINNYQDNNENDYNPYNQNNNHDNFNPNISNYNNNQDDFNPFVSNNTNQNNPSFNHNYQNYNDPNIHPK